MRASSPSYQLPAVLMIILMYGCAPGGDSGHVDAGADIAATVPDTDVFLADLVWERSLPELSNVRNITQRAGYDNQPRFMPDGRSLIFASILDGRQSDIYSYLIADDQIAPFVLTPESEYSPTPVPGAGGISVVRVESDGTQRLWRFAAANAPARLLVKSVKGVGYHTWLADDLLALFIVTDPPTLELLSLPTTARRVIATNIGRSLARIPGENALAFIDKQAGDTWRIVRYDLDSGAFGELISTPPQSEDFAWTSNGGLFMGDGGRLLYWDGHADSHWVEVHDLTDKVMGRITRIDVSPDLESIAFVVDVE